MKGSVPLQEDMRELVSPLCSPPRESTQRRWQSATWKTALPRTRLCWCPDLRLPAPSAVRKYTLCIYVPPRLGYFIKAA